MEDRGRKVARCGATDVWVWQGDITAAGTEAIVNAANNQGWLARSTRVAAFSATRAARAPRLFLK